jgi:hypothetical protein
MPKRAPTPATDYTVRLTFPDGWVVMDEMTGEDYEFLSGISPRAEKGKLTKPEADRLVALLRERIQESSYPNVMQRPLRWLITDLYDRWMKGEEEAALPPDPAGS